MGKFIIDIDRINKAYMRINLALTSGIVASDAERGQMIVMDIQDSSIVGHASLKKHEGEGGFVFRSQKVTEVNTMSLTLGNTLEFLDIRDYYGMPLRIIMPVVAYLALLERGLKPSDVITWTGGTTSVDDLFFQGHFGPLVEVTEKLMPNGVGTLNAILSRLGFLSQGGPNSLDLLQRMRVYPFQILEWINHLAIGDGLSKVFQPKADESSSIRPSIMMLQNVLRKSGTELMERVEGKSQIPVSGFSFVSFPDTHFFRDIAFCGYFPSDKPNYGILIWLHKKEESIEFKDHKELERLELGLHAAHVCKTILDFYDS